MISLDSILNSNENYYLLAFLKEWKCIKKKVIGHITDDLDSSADESDEE